MDTRLGRRCHTQLAGDFPNILPVAERGIEIPNLDIEFAKAASEVIALLKEVLAALT